MIFDELSTAIFRVSVRALGAELEGGGQPTAPLPVPRHVRRRRPSWRGLKKDGAVLRVKIGLERLWATGWDISPNIFMVREYGRLCKDGKIVWQCWEITVTIKKRGKHVSVSEICIPKNVPYLLNDPRTCCMLYNKANGIIIKTLRHKYITAWYSYM